MRIAEKIHLTAARARRIRRPLVRPLLLRSRHLAICGVLLLATLACAQVETQRARRAGRQAYLLNCAPCHGTAADGRGERRAELDPPPRDHTDPAWRATVDETQVYEMIANGVPGTAMPAWSMLPEQELRDLTAYVMSVAELGAFVDGEAPPAGSAPD